MLTYKQLTLLIMAGIATAALFVIIDVSLRFA
jgi:hypothetical protein